MELNNEFKQAIDLMNAGENVFITGRAGTGKSTLLKYWREQTDKSVVVLAPTGVAALNAGGQTIHSFCGFSPKFLYKENIRTDEKKQELLSTINTFIIDEISMVSGLLFEAFKVFLQKNSPLEEIDDPFGGFQVIIVGDLYQLPPVIGKKESEEYYRQYPTPYFFSGGIPENFYLIELNKVYRQESDSKFLNVLNNVREGNINYHDLHYLNEHAKFPLGNDYKKRLVLAPTNRLVNKINKEKLDSLNEKEHVFQAIIEGKFDQNSCPCDVELKLKVGAQVMFVVNDPSLKWVNGTIGEVIGFEDDDTIRVKLNDIERNVQRQKWEMTRYEKSIDGKLTTEKIGTCEQFPLKLAWAITCHKSQGLTLENMEVNLTEGTFFAHGQAYVTLSRVTSIDGLCLTRPLKPYDFCNATDSRIHNFRSFFKSPTNQGENSVVN